MLAIIIEEGTSRICFLIDPKRSSRHDEPRANNKSVRSESNKQPSSDRQQEKAIIPHYTVIFLSRTCTVIIITFSKFPKKIKLPQDTIIEQK